LLTTDSGHHLPRRRTFGTQALLGCARRSGFITCCRCRPRESKDRGHQGNNIGSRDICLIFGCLRVPNSAKSVAKLHPLWHERSACVAF